MFNIIRCKIWWIKCNIPMWKWIFWHWVFRWNIDQDNDLVLSICNVMHIIKYKESTLFKFGRQNYERAPKYVCADASSFRYKENIDDNP